MHISFLLHVIYCSIFTHLFLIILCSLHRSNCNKVFLILNPSNNSVAGYFSLCLSTSNGNSAVFSLKSPSIVELLQPQRCCQTKHSGFSYVTLLQRHYHCSLHLLKTKSKMAHKSLQSALQTCKHCKVKTSNIFLRGFSCLKVCWRCEIFFEIA